MVDPEAARRAYVRVLRRAARGSIRGLVRELTLSRSAAGEAYAVTAALVPGGLARRTRRRPHNPRAAVEVVKKYGRPADVRAPELGIAGRLAAEPVSPRLGGLLGDAGPAAVTWLGDRTGEDPDVLGRALTATAPIVLGALTTALEPRDLGDWIAMVPDDVLDDPLLLPEDAHEAGSIYRRLRGCGRPWWRRWQKVA